MATATTTTTSETVPAAPTPVGTFTQAAASFYVLPLPEESAAWLAAAQQGRGVPISIESYITLKLLAPEASARVQIAGWPQVAEIVAQAETQLIEEFQRELERRMR